MNGLKWLKINYPPSDAEKFLNDENFRKIVDNLTRKIMRFLRFLTIIGLVLSFYLLINDSNTNICKAGNCNLVLTSSYSQFLNIKLPFWGIVYFIAIFLVSFGNLLLLRLLTAVGALVGFLLIYLQFAVIKSFCYFCLVIDLLAILIFIIAQLLYWLSNYEKFKGKIFNFNRKS